MKTPLAGLALLPSLEDMKTIISFREKAADMISGPKLSLASALPHISILQCPFVESELNEKKLAEIWLDFARDTNPLDPGATLGKIYYQPVGWIFADVKLLNWGHILQEAALSALLGAIDTDSIDKGASFEGYSKVEAENFLRFGYRYVGEAFIPHVTLGRAPYAHPTGLAPGLRELYDSTLKHQIMRLDRLVFYSAGQFGSVARIISEYQIRPQVSQ